MEIWAPLGRLFGRSYGVLTAQGLHKICPYPKQPSLTGQRSGVRFRLGEFPMKVRTFRDIDRSLRCAAGRETLALETVGFLRNHADMLEVRRRSPQPLRLLKGPVSEPVFPVKILICEGRRSSERMISYEVLEFKHQGKRRGIEGVVISDSDCSRYWFGMSMLKFFSTNMLGQHFSKAEIEADRSKPAIATAVRRMVFRLIDDRWNGIIAKRSRELFEQGCDTETYGNSLYAFLLREEDVRERDSLSQAEQETRESILTETVLGAWDSFGLTLS